MRKFDKIKSNRGIYLSKNQGWKRIVVLGIVTLGSACQNPDLLWDVGTTTGGIAAGALVGSAVSDQPWVVAGSAAAGGVAGMGLNSLRKTQAESQFMNGYEQGLSDSIKRQYWIQSGMQRIITDQEDNE